MNITLIVPLLISEDNWHEWYNRIITDNVKLCIEVPMLFEDYL